MTDEELDYLFHSGKLPAWIYYQQSNKPIQIKLQEQRQRILDNISSDTAISIAFDKEIEEAIDDILSALN